MTLQSPSSRHWRLAPPTRLLAAAGALPLSFQLITSPTVRAFELASKDKEEPTTTQTLSVKRTTTVTLKPTGTGVPLAPGGGDSTLLGCYAHPSTQNPGGALGANTVRISLAGSAMQQFKATDCLAKCAAAGHHFAAIEGGRGCFCASSLGSGAVKVNDLYCDIPCVGDGRTSCGGSEFSVVYSLGKPQTVTSTDGSAFGALDASTVSGSSGTGSIGSSSSEREAITYPEHRESSSPTLPILLTIFTVLCFSPLMFFLCTTYRRRVAIARSRGHHHRRRRINSITLEPHTAQNQPRPRPPAADRRHFDGVSVPAKAHAVLGISTGGSAFRRRHSAPFPSPEEAVPVSERRIHPDLLPPTLHDDMSSRLGNSTYHHTSQPPPHPRRPSKSLYKDDYKDDYVDDDDEIHPSALRVGKVPSRRPVSQSLPGTPRFSPRDPPGPAPQTSLPALPPQFDWNLASSSSSSSSSPMPSRIIERPLPQPSSPMSSAAHQLSRPTTPLTPLGSNPFVAPSASKQEYKAWRPTEGAQQDDAAKIDRRDERDDHDSLQNAVIFFMPE